MVSAKPPGRSSTRIYLAIAAGGALGSVARYLCAVAGLALLGPVFPWGTLGVNIAGSFLIGLHATLTEPDGRVFATPTMRQGVMGGVGLHLPQEGPPLVIDTLHQPGVAAKGLRRRHILHPVAFPQAIGGAEGGHTAFGRNAGAG